MSDCFQQELLEYVYQEVISRRSFPKLSQTNDNNDKPLKYLLWQSNMSPNHRHLEALIPLYIWENKIAFLLNVSHVF